MLRYITFIHMIGSSFASSILLGEQQIFDTYNITDTTGFKKVVADDIFRRCSVFIFPESLDLDIQDTAPHICVREKLLLMT